MTTLNNSTDRFFGIPLGFYNELPNFIEHLKKAQVEGHIKDRYVVLSHLVLECIEYRNSADLFLGCACVNLLARYANRQCKKTAVAYDFKMYLCDIIDGIAFVNDPNIRIGYDASNGNGAYLVINFSDFQFSYMYKKHMDLVLKLSNGSANPWDGFRKQPISVEIFKYAFTNKWLSCMTHSGATLKDVLMRGIEEFKSGHLSLVNGMIAKMQVGSKFNDTMNSAQKNYFRDKLREANGHLTLLCAKLKMEHDHYLTFVAVRPYMRGIETTTICNHLNIFYDDIAGVVPASELVVGKKYCIVAYCVEYQNGSGRMGIKIAKDIQHSPIVPLDEAWIIPRSTRERCFKFRVEEYLKN